MGGGVAGSEECSRRLLLYLRLFLAVVHATRQLHERGVTHFDIKCDNIMLRRLPRPGDELQGERLKRLVCLVDFGESVFTPGALLGSARGAGRVCQSVLTCPLLHQPRFARARHVHDSESRHRLYQEPRDAEGRWRG